MTQGQSNLPSAPVTLGSEALNSYAVERIKLMIRGDETVVAYSGFDFESKLIAVTSQRIIIADKNGSANSLLNLNDLVLVAQENRTLIIGTRYTSAKYQMGDANTVTEIERLINRLVNADYCQNRLPYVIGNERLSSGALSKISGLIREEEKILALSGFNWGNNVIAVTDQRVIVADEKRQILFDQRHIWLFAVLRLGRTLFMQPIARKGEPVESIKFQMGKEVIVAELVALIVLQRERQLNQLG